MFTHFKTKFTIDIPQILWGQEANKMIRAFPKIFQIKIEQHIQLEKELLPQWLPGQALAMLRTQPKEEQQPLSPL